jgi:diaminopimelate epimerase
MRSRSFSGVDELRFSKYQGTGNDFVMVVDLDDLQPIDHELAVALCDRRFGVGADGVIRITRSDEADFSMDYRNADGTVAEMCGNGIRCLGALVFDEEYTRATELSVMTRSGLRHLSLGVKDGAVQSVSVEMGSPRFGLDDIPMRGVEGPTFLGRPFEAGGRTFTASAVSMGNPHLVLLLDEELDEAQVRTIGPAIERDPRFPERTNVEFVRRSGDSLVVRVWERGSGATMACGTGACAALAASAQAGIVGRRARLTFPGGDVEVDWRDDDEAVLTGPAVRVFDGVLDPAWLSSRTVAAAVR